ncbi:MAG: hydrogenase maturation protease [Dehalococcoidia bacterium]|nr:hydrogenase maturation protease [Dehalococcoidia bacterium]MCL2615223.1 hydrogenase maturation protease [Dehalococcoidia bacterium]
MTRILVCGVGNKLKKDDGLGPLIAEELDNVELPPGVDVADFGISGFKCALKLEGYHKVVFVDAISLPGSEPGRLHRLKINKEALMRSPRLSDFSVSMHETDLERIMATASVLNIYPEEVVIIGCEPADTAVGLGLTPSVEAAVPQVLQMVMQELS